MSTRFYLKFLHVLLKKYSTPESFILQFFTWKISGVIFIGEGLAILQLQND